MKKLLSLMLILSISYVFAQEEYFDVVTLKNGSTIFGKITEFNLNENLSIQTEDGYGFLFRTADVKDIRKEPKKVEPRFIGNNNTVYTQVPQQNFGQNQFSQNPNTQQRIASNISNTQNPTGRIQNSTPQQYANSTPNNLTYPGNFQNVRASQDINRSQNGAIAPNFSQNQRNTGNSGYQYPTNTYHSKNRSNPNGFTNPNSNFNQTNRTDRQTETFIPNSNYNSLSQNQQALSYSLSPTQTSINPNIFTDVNSYGTDTSSVSVVDCNQGFGNYTFANTTNSFVIVSLQQRQKDGYFGDFKEITIEPNSKGYFSNLKTGDYPFLVKIKNSVNGNQNDYVILGRGNARVEACKNQQIRIE